MLRPPAVCNASRSATWAVPGTARRAACRSRDAGGDGHGGIRAVHTVQYHLSKVFAKLAISSRSQLDRVLPPARPPSVVHTPRRESHVGPAHPAQLDIYVAPPTPTVQ